ncbi:LysR family transcriptional regulator [Acinetobacter stercoris]|uniref:HTH-type transcriptional regulator DmlR n=1 Tax=Acinetobacter stercoris TaxID=2126983 RepID=A0A2U3MUX9_9GAMM|nr:LysR family transcriptional regulator [Acinetobacter stercoris]SPL69204.1 HTH-type transcriptional regulator DmlR [Acinetobacter stercoris]
MFRHYDDLQIGSLELFCLTVEKKSFSAAAITAGISPAAVSRAISRIESKFGVKLFIRTTRQLKITDAGQHYYYFCKQALNNLLEGEMQITGEQENPVGLLKISVPTAYAHYRLLPKIADFSNKFPQIKLEIHVSNHNVNLVTDDYDIAIRGNELTDSGLIARKLEDAELCIVATPNYLKKHPEPLHIEDLKQHECIQFELPSSGKPAPWTLMDAGKKIFIDVQGKIICKDDYLSTLILVKSGVGLMQVYRFTVEQELKTGELLEVLKPYNQTTRPFYLLYPKTNYQSSKLKAFINYMLGR